MPCTNGRDAIGLFIGFAEEPPARLEIASDGTFSGMFSVGDFLIDPFAVSEEYWLSGRFVRRGRAARLVVRSRHVGEGGTVCETGELERTARRLSAKRRG